MAPVDGTGTWRATGLSLVETSGFADYRLLDSGEGRKLERFGKIIVDRPEPQALWRRRAESHVWDNCHAVFSGDGDDEAGRWRVQKAVPETWPITVDGITLLGRLSAFRHLGVFPEQLPYWRWMAEKLAGLTMALGDERPRVLNLFAYTGAASLIAAKAGAEVVHVDGSKKAIGWARENQAISGLGDKPIRWILEDARKFVARERRRGRTYHIILADPPKFGRGPGGEVWELFDHLPALAEDCAHLLDPREAHMVLTSYAIRASALAIGQLVAEKISGRAGSVEVGELAIRPEGDGWSVPTSQFVRWSSAGQANSGQA
ncbi:MAG: class I SAM-dependent methyltransferase [Hyphomicrobiaceae bacterium]